MAIDTEALVTPLAFDICTASRKQDACICCKYKTAPCPHAAAAARAAISNLLPQIIELCAETAALDVDWASFGKREIEQWDGGPDAVRDYRLGIAAGRSIATAIRALIPTQGADHG